jgi:hypothetical protein
MVLKHSFRILRRNYGENTPTYANKRRAASGWHFIRRFFQRNVPFFERNVIWKNKYIFVVDKRFYGPGARPEIFLWGVGGFKKSKRDCLIPGEGTDMYSRNVGIKSTYAS